MKCIHLVVVPQIRLFQLKLFFFNLYYYYYFTYCILDASNSIPWYHVLHCFCPRLLLYLLKIMTHASIFICPKEFPLDPSVKPKRGKKCLSLKTAYLAKCKTHCRKLNIGKLLFTIFIWQFIYSLCLLYFQLKANARLTTVYIFCRYISVFWNRRLKHFLKSLRFQTG